ncbi:MAG TPA: phosphotransferase [Pasteurellaceae bacterium]|nr:phosphotransferase [Pasteurellaceae bacterium]
MLTNADKQIIARDKVLPGLAVLLDSTVLLTKLQKLTQLENAVQADIQYLRYKPGNSCACTVKVKLADGTSKYYFAKALTAERFEQSWNRPKRQALIRNGDIYAPLAIFEFYIMLLHPAHDREIRHLGWLINDDLRQQVLKLCALSPMENDRAEIDILRYKPERRLVARIHAGKQSLAVMRCTTPADFGKILTGAAFGAARGNMKLLGIDGDLCTLVTDWQEGHSLCPENNYSPSDKTLARLAKALSQIHHASYRHPIKYGIHDEIQVLQGMQLTFPSILPEYAHWFARLTEQVQQGLSVQPEMFTLIHGDFSLDQVIKNERNELHILDWDRSASGHPLMDLASLQARLELQVIEGVLPRWLADNLIASFLHSYQENTALDLGGLDYFVASAVLRLAIEPFRKRVSHWPQYTLQLLQRVEVILANVNNLYADRPEKQVDLSLDPILLTLTEPAKIQNLLMNTLPPAERGNVEKATLKRYKIQRRALIDYEIRTEHGKEVIIGKYRNKGLDKRSFMIQQALWDGGFKGATEVSVAEPLGILPELKTWLQRRVNGLSVGDVLMRENGRLAFLGEAVAKALTALHNSNVAQQLDLPIWTPLQELQILQDRLAQAQSLLPPLSDRIASLLTGCEKLVQQLPDTPLVSVHRDFYQDQILERNGLPGHMVLLDLDLLCQGPAALDAGNYLAHIMELAIRKYADIHALEAHQTGFINSFLKYSPTVKLQDIEAYTTLSLTRHIYISTQFQDRKHTTDMLLAICEERLKKGENL